MGPASLPERVLFFLPWGMMDGGLFITDSVTLSRTSKICSLRINALKANYSVSTVTHVFCCILGVYDTCFFLPCFLVHGLMHNKAPVDVQDSLAHVYVLLQKDLDVIGWFQEENIGGVGDEYLRSRQASMSTISL